jgi:hypothetical protein
MGLIGGIVNRCIWGVLHADVSAVISPATFAVVGSDFAVPRHDQRGTNFCLSTVRSADSSQSAFASRPELLESGLLRGGASAGRRAGSVCRGLFTLWISS